MVHEVLVVWLSKARSGPPRLSSFGRALCMALCFGNLQGLGTGLFRLARFYCTTELGLQHMSVKCYDAVYSLVPDPLARRARFPYNTTTPERVWVHTAYHLCY